MFLLKDMVSNEATLHAYMILNIYIYIAGTCVHVKCHKNYI